MAKSELERRLDALRDKIKNSRPVHGFQDLPSGLYPAKITAATLGMSKGNADRGTEPAPQVVFEYTVTGDKCAGRKVRRYINLESESADGTTGMDRLQGDLEVLGLDMVDEPEDIAKMLRKAAGLEVRLKARTVDERTFYDVVDLLGGDGSISEESEPESSENEEQEEEEDEKQADPTRAQVKTMPLKKLKELAESIDITVGKMDEKKLRAKILEELGL